MFAVWNVSDGVVSDGLSAIMTLQEPPFASNAFQFILKLPESAVMPNCTDAPDSSGDGAANVSIPAGFNEVAQSLPVLYDLKSPESSPFEPLYLVRFLQSVWHFFLQNQQ